MAKRYSHVHGSQDAQGRVRRFIKGSIGMEADNQTSLKPVGAIKLKCAWHRCGKEFEPKQKGQRFCPGGKCKDAHNNWLKMTGIHLCPRALYYVHDLAIHRIPPITNDEMANEMILKAMNADGESLTNEEAAGLKEVSGQ